jgi:hypothetical protein
LELLVILREWLYGEGEVAKEFTLPELQTIQNTLGMDEIEFAEFFTGLSCDSYADLIEERLEYAASTCSVTSAEELADQVWSEDEIRTCYTVYRIWNQQHTAEFALDQFRWGLVTTAEGVLGVDS